MLLPIADFDFRALERSISIVAIQDHPLHLVAVAVYENRRCTYIVKACLVGNELALEDLPFLVEIR